MRYVSTTRWPWAIAAYVGAGALISLARLDLLASALGMRPGIGVAISVNIVLPAAVLLITLWYPRLRFAVVGGALAFLPGYFLTNLLQSDWHFWMWTPGFFFNRLSPILVVGAVVSGIIAALACAAINRLRIVGDPPQPDPCIFCGYSLFGVTGESSCPECGTVRRSASVP